MSESVLQDFHFYATSLASLFTFFAACRVAKRQHEIYKKKKIKSGLTHNQLISPEQACKNEYVGKKILVHGEVKCLNDPPIEVNLAWNKKEKLVAYMKFTEAIYSNDEFDLGKNNYQFNLKRLLKFCSIDIKRSIGIGDKLKPTFEGLLINGFDQSNYERVIEVLNWDEDRRCLTIFEHIKVLLLSVIRALSLFGPSREDGSAIRGLEIGVRKIDAGVKIGAAISVLGTISLSSDGKFSIDPSAIFKDRLSYACELDASLEKLINQRNIWLLGSLIGTIYVGRRAFNYCKINKITSFKKIKEHISRMFDS